MKPQDKKYLTIGEVAEEISTSAQQLRKWERAGLMPEPALRKKVGKRLDRRYTWEQVEQMRQLRYKYRVGAPTAEEQAIRAKIQAELREDDETVDQGTSAPTSTPEDG